MLAPSPFNPHVPEMGMTKKRVVTDSAGRVGQQAQDNLPPSSAGLAGGRIVTDGMCNGLCDELYSTKLPCASQPQEDIYGGEGADSEIMIDLFDSTSCDLRCKKAFELVWSVVDGGQ